MSLGGAAPGDKTMVDALMPALATPFVEGAVAAVVVTASAGADLAAVEAAASEAYTYRKA